MATEASATTTTDYLLVGLDLRGEHLREPVGSSAEVGGRLLAGMARLPAAQRLTVVSDEGSGVDAEGQAVDVG